MANFHRIKRIFTASALGLILLQTLLSPILAQHAQAAGVTFTWKDAQTVTVSGAINGDLVEAGVGSQKFGGQSLSGSSSCNYLLVSVDFAANTTAVPPPPTGPITLPQGQTNCDTKNLGVSGSQQTIQGTRPGGPAPETTPQKAEYVDLISAQAKDKSPVTVTATLKDSTGKVVSTQTASQTVTPDPGKGSGGSGFDVDYKYMFPLTAGTYSICFSAIDTTCHSFTKVKYVSGNQVYGTYGQFKYIIAEALIDSYLSSGSGYTMSGQTLQLKLNGKIIQSIKSAPYTYTPTAAEKASAGGAITKSTASFVVTFPNVDPGKYQVCLASNNACVDIEKIADQPTDPNPVIVQGDPSDPFGLKAQFDANQCSDPANASSPGCAPADPTCESNGFSLSWIMCPIVEGLAKAVDGIYNKVIQPLLVTQTLDRTSTDGKKVYAAWANFRIYGDIFLIIALLVVVFGQSIGGGLVDAYTAKKILPRILLTAILINLSYYIVAVMVDLTNILGSGILTLLTAPFSQANDFSLTLNGGSSGVGLAAIGGGIGLAILNYGALIELLWFTVLLPMLLLFIAIMVTVLLRRGLIILLVLVSPVAFALYCLPNTEQYFRKWWDALFKTLLVYPIIAALFGVAKILSVTINWGGDTSGLAQSIAGLVSIAALVVPLFLIPYSFRLAGGILGRVHDLTSSAAKNIQKQGYLKNRRERAQLKARTQRLQRRQDAYQGLQAAASKDGANFLTRRGGRFLANRLGGYNIEAESSALRAQTMKDVNDQIATGRDEEIRGLTVNKQTSARRVNADTGAVQYQSLGGAWINEADVDAGYKRWGNNTFAQQGALAYEMRKAQSEEQIQSVADNYASVATGPGGWGNSAQQAGGSWIGAAFEHQNQHLEYKYTDWQTGDLSKAAGFVDEVYEKKGSYPLSQMSSNSIESLKVAYAAAEAAGDTPEANDQKMKIAAIAENFMHEMSAGGVSGMAGEVPIIDSEGRTTRQASTPGSAHVAERVRELATMTRVAMNPATGAAGAAPSGSYGPDHAPTPNRREQK